MKKYFLFVASLLLLVCSAQAATFTNSLVVEWERDFTTAVNPWPATIGEWTVQYDTDRIPPYLTLTNYSGSIYDTGDALWYQGQCAWHNPPNSGNVPQIGHGYWNPAHADGSVNFNNLQIRLQTENVSGSTLSVGWIAPDLGDVEAVLGRWRTDGGGDHWGDVNVYVDQVRSDTIIYTPYSYTSNIGTDQYHQIDVSTPFSVQAGDIVLVTFEAEHNLSTRWYELVSGSSEDYRIVFTPIPEPAVCTILLAGLILFIRKAV